MYDVLFFVAIFAGWIALNAWVLPYFGIQTCMSGACRVPHKSERHSDPNQHLPQSPAVPESKSR
ncbi:MAG: hypothetical protein JSS49_23620 [Planctomycetes bacterium]|nr:hypothetical protein [Planctomycetota bacterium]